MEQDWWDYQFSLQVIEFGQWGWEASYGVRTDLYCAAVTITSDGVGWLRRQVEGLREGVMQLVWYLGGFAKYRRAVGSTTFRRVNEIKWTGENTVSSMSSNSSGPVTDVWNYPDSMGGAARDITVNDVIHELAHHWDANLGYGPSRAVTGRSEATEEWARYLSYYIACTGDESGLGGYNQGLIVIALRYPTTPFLWRVAYWLSVAW
jgi:hypothetical protein